MMTWTLWLLLTLDSGQLTVMKSRAFTTELECERAAMSVVARPITGVVSTAAVCKKKTDV